MGTKEQVKEPAAADEVLTPELEAFIRKWKNEPGNLIMVLHKVQEHFGYVPRPAAFQVADQLGIPLAKVYGVLTFYHFFKLKKPGRFRISVCMGTACYVKRAAEIVAALQAEFGVEAGNTTTDGKLSLNTARCLGSCGLAPVLVMDGDVVARQTPEEALARVRELLLGAAHKPEAISELSPLSANEA